MGYKLRKIRSSKGGVMVEVAIVTFFLMLLVIGIGAIHVEINAVENAGRSMKEVTEIGTQLVMEEGSLTANGKERLKGLAAARAGGNVDTIGIRFTHIERNAISGEYTVVQTADMGGLSIPPRIQVVLSPDPNPGIRILGESLELDMGQDILIFEFRREYQSIFAGVGAPRLYDQVSFSLLP